MYRYGIQCSGCGLWAALEAEHRREAAALLDGVACPVCGSAWSIRGAIEGGRVVEEAHTVPCNTACVNAVGTRCECACGGRHHGSRRVVTVRRDAGKAPLNLPMAQARGFWP